jgi:hypothetical protein
VGGKYRITEAERDRRSGHMRAVRATQSREQCVRGGKTRGDLHATNKTGVCGRSPIKRRADGKLGGHISQHINKGILKPECELCLEILSRNAMYPSAIPDESPSHSDGKE